MDTRRIGTIPVSVIGYGAMPLSLPGHPDEAQALRTVHAALDAGITLIDTADAYAPDAAGVGHNERLVAKALATWRGDASTVLVATKGGHTRTGDGGWGRDASPAALRRACEASCKALGVPAIGLYQLHRPDQRVPFTESVGALADLRAEGLVRQIGLSNVTPAQIEVARTITEIAAVQNELSPAVRTSLPQLELCAALGIAFLPYSPLGGMDAAGDLGRRHPVFAAVAAERGVSPQQVALAWLHGLADVVIPIPGARRPESIRDSAAAAQLTLGPQELARLSRG